jgi:adenylate cyclase
MTETLHLLLYKDRNLLQDLGEVAGPVVLGRLNEGETTFSIWRHKDGSSRAGIAPSHETTISRKSVLLKATETNSVQVKNLRDNLDLSLEDGTKARKEIPPGGFLEGVPLPILLHLGVGYVVRVEQPLIEPPPQVLAEKPLPPGQMMPPRTLPMEVLAGAELPVLVRWLQSAMDVVQNTATEADFFPRAVRAVVEMLNMDCALVLLRENEGWRTACCTCAKGVAVPAGWQPSQRLLQKVINECGTIWRLPEPGRADFTVDDLEAVVVAPILNRSGAVTGALYADRRQAAEGSNRPLVTEPEAMLVELLARGIAAGLARVEQERAANRERERFEQFFTRPLADRLTRDPGLLAGQDANVAVLFCDIRGFSRISEKLGPVRTFEWINDVMQELSRCVIDQDGVLVDYIGDELMAMWGAPTVQLDHAQRACRAALAMRRRVPDLHDKWKQELGESFALGIGVNTGPARVGNTGSRLKFKYGPLGPTVNVASRVQGANKYLKAQLLVTGETRAKLLNPKGQLAPEFAERRLCKVRVVNITQSIELYELVEANQPGWQDLKNRYETALSLFEQCEFRQAARTLANLLAEERYRGDGPSLALLSRTVAHLVDEALPFDPVWTLPGK